MKVAFTNQPKHSGQLFYFFRHIRQKYGQYVGVKSPGWADVDSLSADNKYSTGYRGDKETFSQPSDLVSFTCMLLSSQPPRDSYTKAPRDHPNPSYRALGTDDEKTDFVPASQDHEAQGIKNRVYVQHSHTCR
jgi:hypothetical protein